MASARCSLGLCLQTPREALQALDLHRVWQVPAQEADCTCVKLVAAAAVLQDAAHGLQVLVLQHHVLHRSLQVLHLGGALQELDVLLRSGQ